MNNDRLILYGNGSSGNHGCEAIIRGTQKALERAIVVLSNNPEEDKRYGIGQIADIHPARTGYRRITDFLPAYASLRARGNYIPMDGIAYLDTIRKARGITKVALSAGGDNYCYGDTGIYEYLNKKYHKYGFQTVLWGCSIEPDIVPEITEDLNRYDLVVTRECITYNAVRQVCNNTLLAPDPAFFMKSEKTELPNLFHSSVVGINLSPMVMSNEKIHGIIYQNYYNLIRWILKETDLNIALIPHVVWKINDDRIPLRNLLREFKASRRVIQVDDCSAPEIKYVISKCRCFVGARTHATIAAYSSGVPTLAVGYSVKARGIARDLFGNKNHYVVPVQSLDNNDHLVYEFRRLLDGEKEVTIHLRKTLPGYLSKMKSVAGMVQNLLDR